MVPQSGGRRHMRADSRDVPSLPLEAAKMIV